MRRTKTYRRIPVKPRKTMRYCMDVEGGNLGENARIVRYPCHSGKNQKFHYNKTTKQIVAQHSGKCVENVDGRLFQRKCSSKKYTQKWRKGKKNNRMISLSDRKCIDSDVVTDKYGSSHLITSKC
jgi:hypothetical protein